MPVTAGAHFKLCADVFGQLAFRAPFICKRAFRVLIGWHDCCRECAVIEDVGVSHIIGRDKAMDEVFERDEFVHRDVGKLRLAIADVGTDCVMHHALIPKFDELASSDFG